MKIVSLIVAEDDRDDQLLIREAFEECDIDTKDIVFANDGEELMDLLPKQENETTLILLDLNMPRKDGREVLKEIRANDKTRHIPIIILSTSQSSEDVKFTYKYGANTYFKKPSTFAELVSLCALVKEYWMEKAHI